jgi:DNA repair protein RecO (recombination protein O)
MPQERLYRTEGIVLRERDQGEFDRVLTLLTPEGKLTAIARGIRRPVSRKVGQLGLFFRSQLMLARGSTFDTISQADAVEDFPALRADLARFGYACSCGELAERLSPEGEESKLIYELLLLTLRHLASESDPRLWARYFELHLLAHSGYRPEMFTCVQCQAPIREEWNYFSAEQGGLLCAKCGVDVPQAKAVSINAQKVVRFLQTRPVDEVRALLLSPATHAEVEALLRGYLEYLLEGEWRSAAILPQLRREPRPPA